MILLDPSIAFLVQINYVFDFRRGDVVLEQLYCTTKTFVRLIAFLISMQQ